MKKIYAKPVLYFLIVSLVIIGGACKKNQSSGFNPSTTTLTHLLANGSNTTIFNSAVIKAKLDTVFGSSSLFTLFVPNNDACNQSGFSQSVINGFSYDQARQWVLYQTYAGAALTAESFIGHSEMKLIMANGDSIFVRGDSNQTFVNGFQLNTAEAVASNGVMLALQNVFVMPTQNLMQMVASDTTLSFFNTAIQQSTAIPDSLSTRLSNNAPYTVLAPDNDAFRKLGFNTPADLDSVSPDSLRSLVLLHLIPQRLFSYDISDSSTFQTVSDSTLMFNFTGLLTTVQVQGSVYTSNVISLNSMAINGVLFKIDEILDR